MTAVNYTPDAECPLFLRCLEQWFFDPVTGEVNREMIGYLQAMAGYACSGMLREELIWIHVGVGLNGKTTFTKVIQRILGDYAGQVEPEMIMSDGDKTSPGALSTLAQLRGMRLVLASEGDSADTLSASMLKRVASRSKIRAKLMRQDTFEFQCSHKLWFDTNHMMTVRDRDDGTWRRMRIIRWVNKIADKDIISNLDDKLWAEREGIFQWMLRGAQRWFLHGALSNAHEPRQVKQEIASFRADQDWFSAFLSECCITDASATVPTPHLRGVFEMWYKDNHGPKPPLSQFWKALSEKGYENDRGTAGNFRLRHGLKLIEQSRAYQKFQKSEAASGVPMLPPAGKPPAGW
jgi:putative DNA primase/helicase